MFDENDELVAICTIRAGSYFDFSKRQCDRLWKYTITRNDDTIQFYDKVEGQRSWKVKLFLNLKV